MIDNFTDDRPEALETAQGLWSLLLPHGLQGGALSHLITSSMDLDNDVEMDGVERGWTQTQTQLWFDFLTAKGLKGISRDTWQMVGEQSEHLQLDRIFNAICLPSFANSSVLSTHGLAITTRNVSIICKCLISLIPSDDVSRLAVDF